MICNTGIPLQLAFQSQKSKNRNHHLGTETINCYEQDSKRYRQSPDEYVTTAGH